jgi:integrase
LWYARIRYNGTRPAFSLPWCRSEVDAKARAALMTAVVDALPPEALAVAYGLLDAIAKADTAEKLSSARKVAERLATGATTVAPPTLVGSTFGDVARQWVKGELAARYPSRVDPKRSAHIDRARLDKYILPHVGSIPMSRLTAADCDRVLEALPDELSAATRKAIGQVMHRVGALAVDPLRLVATNPVPKAPKVRRSEQRPQEILRPAECDAFLRSPNVALEVRVFVGFLSREGMRLDEAARLTWADLDLEHGLVRLEKNKTDAPRSWALCPDAAGMLRRWFEHLGRPGRDKLVFVRPDGSPLALRSSTYRRWLAVAGITRPELFEGTKTSDLTSFHGLRALFVTNALATGRSEAWVSDRTGHTTSAQIATYHRRARTFTDATLAPLGSLEHVIVWPADQRKARSGLVSRMVSDGSKLVQASNDSCGDSQGFRCVDSTNGPKITSPITPFQDAPASVIPDVSAPNYNAHKAPIDQSTSQADQSGPGLRTVDEGAVLRAVAAGDWSLVARLSAELAERKGD